MGSLRATSRAERLPALMQVLRRHRILCGWQGPRRRSVWEWAGRGLRIAQAPVMLDFGHAFAALDPDQHRLRVSAPVMVVRRTGSGTTAESADGDLNPLAYCGTIMPMPEGWQWDSSLYRGSAAYYTRGRLPYAPNYAAQLAGRLDLRGQDRLLDVGCGPGVVTLALAPHFAAVIGIDPDPDMLIEAGRHAATLGVRNASWAALRAEELPAGLGTFHVMLFAQSFHWTDRERVAATAFGMIDPGGYFVHVSERQGVPTDPVAPAHPAPPREAIAALVRTYLGAERRAGQGVLRFGTQSGERAIVEAAGFTGYQRVPVPAGATVERSADDMVAWVFSRSDSAPHLFGDRLGDFERDLRARLHDASPGGRFAEQLPDTEVWIWQRP